MRGELLITIHDSDYMDMDIGMAYRFLDTRTVSAELHNHNYYEYFIVTSGTIIHKINGKKTQLNPGTLVFIRPSDRHCYCTDEENSFKIINISFRTLHFESLIKYFDSPVLKSMIEAPDPPTITLPSMQITALKKRHYQLNVITDKSSLAIQLKALLADVFAYFIVEFERQSRDDSKQWLQSLLDQMNTPENIEEGLPALIRFSGFSHGHLCRIMKQELGITPTKYITNLRLQYAANLLATTDYDILSISIQLGFSSLSHFITIFKEKFGLPPSKYRAVHNSKAW